MAATEINKFVDIDMLKGIQRAWTRQYPLLQNLYMWDRRRIMGIPPVQRRQERLRSLSLAGHPGHLSMHVSHTK